MSAKFELIRYSCWYGIRRFFRTSSIAGPGAVVHAVGKSKHYIRRTWSASYNVVHTFVYGASCGRCDGSATLQAARCAAPLWSRAAPTPALLRGAVHRRGLLVGLIRMRSVGTGHSIWGDEAEYRVRLCNSFKRYLVGWRPEQTLKLHTRLVYYPNAEHHMIIGSLCLCTYK